MGIKAAVFAIYEGEPGYFGGAPVPDMASSSELALRLPLRAFGTGRNGKLDVWPPSALVGIGVYDHGAIVVHRSLMDECLRAASHPVTEELLRMYPTGTFVSFGLHSVVNYFGYTVIEGGQLVRNFGGAEDHIDADDGSLLPEEAPHFENSTVRDGMRYFTSSQFPDEEFDAPAYGGTLVMALSVQLFGCTLNDLREPPVMIPYFSRRPWWKFW
jgi:hypothetical protein